MLPTTGFFKDIECPFFEDSCDRPYCHFRHRKKNPEPADAAKEDKKDVSAVPTYNPTPKSQLENTRSHIPIKYVPDLAGLSERSSLRKLQIDKFPTYKPTPLSLLGNVNRVSSTVPADGKSENEESSRYDNITINYPTTEYNPNEPLKTDDIDFEDLSNEFDMIDEIINEENVVPEDKQEKQSQKDEFEKNHSRSRSNSSDQKEKKSSKTEHEKKHKEDKRRDKKDSLKEKGKTSTKSSKSSHSKEKGGSKHGESSERKKSSDKYKSSSSSKQKNKEKSSSSNRSSSHKDKKHKDDRKSSSKHKDHKEKLNIKKERHVTSDESSDAETKKDHLVINKETVVDKSEEESDIDTAYLEATEIDFDSEDETLQECYRIFNEYKPEEPQIQREVLPKKDEVTEEINVGKKRVAHEKAEKLPQKVPPSVPKRPLDAGLIMTNRFKIARLAQANDEQKRIAEAVKKTTLPINKQSKLSSNHKKPPAIINKPTESTSLIDEIISGGNTKPKRIAPVQNVNLMQRAKAKIEEMARQKAVATLQKTQAQTISKGARRVAHVPEFSLSDIPDVLQAEKSKLPVNVRTRYLTMIADECVKLYLSKDDAYQRALNEEFKCYERCKVLATYRNSAMLSINRLRKEVQEREKAGLDPMSSFDESGSSNVSSELKGRKFYENIQNFVLTEEELKLHGYPRESNTPGIAIIHNQRATVTQRLSENERKCARCSKLYIVDRDGFPLYPEDCIYHPLRKRTFRGESIYLCCRGSDDLGCATSHSHVCDTPQDSDLEGYQTTLDPYREDDSRSYAVYALDCEMCYTTKGLELTRVTIVDTDCKTVYESLVKPLNPIIDYNTRFSGITKEQMDKTSTSILQVQANILHLCNSKTILIGHSLESDMKALKIVHSNVVDTSVLFPHKLGLPHKRALKALASDYLKKIIQNDVSGHDSAEDALTCMELIIWKVKEDLKVKGIKL